MKSVLSIVNLISTFSPIVGCGVFLSKIHRPKGHNKFILVYLIMCLIADVLTYFRIVSAPIVFNLQDFLQFILITTVYVIITKDRSVWLLFIGMITYCVGFVITLVVQGLHVYNTYLWALSSFIIVIFTLTYPDSTFRKQQGFIPHDQPNNSLVINAAFSFYFLATLCFFILDEFIFQEMNNDMMTLTWICHNTCNIIKNLGLALAFYLASAKS